MLRIPQNFWRFLRNFPEIWQDFDRILIWKIENSKWYGRSAIRSSFNSVRDKGRSGSSLSAFAAIMPRIPTSSSFASKLPKLYLLTPRTPDRGAGQIWAYLPIFSARFQKFSLILCSLRTQKSMYTKAWKNHPEIQTEIYAELQIFWKMKNSPPKYVQKWCSNDEFDRKLFKKKNQKEKQ